MFKKLVMLEGVEESVDRSVVISVVKDLIHNLAIGDDVRILFPNQYVEDQTNLTTMSGRPLLKTNKQLLVSAEFNFDEDFYGAEELNLLDNQPLMWDQEIGFIVSPLYMVNKVTLNLQWRFKSRVEADNLRNQLRIRSARYLRGFEHNPWYRYILPEYSILLATEIHRAKTDGNHTLTDYLETILNKQVERITNQNESYTTLSKREQQSHVVGDFGFTVVPDKVELDDQSYYHMVQMDYTFTYNKPVAIQLQYPWLVYNKPIHRYFYDENVTIDFNTRFMQPSVFAHSSGFKGNSIEFPYGAPYPHFVKWQPSTTLPGSAGLMHIHAVVDPNNPRALFGLGELHAEFSFDTQLWSYLVTHWDKLLHYGQSAVTIHLYEDGYLRSSDNVSITPELVLSTTFDMDIKSQYVIYVTLQHDLHRLSEDAKTALRQSPRFLRALLATYHDDVDELLPIDDIVVPADGPEYIPTGKFDQIMLDNQSRQTGFGDGRSNFWPRIATLITQVTKGDN